MTPDDLERRDRPRSSEREGASSGRPAGRQGPRAAARRLSQPGARSGQGMESLVEHLREEDAERPPRAE
jgi:hypothetical protein